MEQREQCELAQTLPSRDRGRRSQITESTDFLYSKEYRRSSSARLLPQGRKNKGIFFRLLMDDSHRDDCLILVENKGFMLVEELERTCSLSTSNRLTTRQSSNKFGSVLAARRFNTLPTTLNSSSINNLFLDSCVPLVASERSSSAWIP